VFQPSHEERRVTANLAHNQRVLAEIFLLSFSEALLTSGLSMFGYVSSNFAGIRPTILLTAIGHKVPKPPCRQAVSLEPCNLTPPKGVQCQNKPLKEDVTATSKSARISRMGSSFFFD
jgi:xyloglucan fucosyltransferase